MIIVTSILMGACSILVAQIVAVFILHVLPRRRERWKPISRPDVSHHILQSFEAKSRKQLIRAFSSSIAYFDAYTEGESCVWLNALFSRLYCQFTDGFFLTNYVAKKIGIELSEVIQSWVGGTFLNEVRLQHLQLADAPPILKRIKVFKRAKDQTSWFALTDWLYNPVTLVEFKGKLIFDVPFHAVVEVKNIRAKAYVRFSREEPVMAYSLLELPSFDFTVDLNVNQVRAPKWLRVFIEEYFIPLHVRRKFVLPHCKTLVFGAADKKVEVTPPVTHPLSAEKPLEDVIQKPMESNGSPDVLPQEDQVAPNLATATDAKDARSFSPPVSPSVESGSLKAAGAVVSSASTITGRLLRGVSAYRDPATNLRDRVTSVAGGLVDAARTKLEKRLQQKDGPRRASFERSQQTLIVASKVREEDEEERTSKAVSTAAKEGTVDVVKAREAEEKTMAARTSSEHAEVSMPSSVLQDMDIDPDSASRVVIEGSSSGVTDTLVKSPLLPPRPVPALPNVTDNHLIKEETEPLSISDDTKSLDDEEIRMFAYQLVDDLFSKIMPAEDEGRDELPRLPERPSDSPTNMSLSSILPALPPRENTAAHRQ